MIRLPLGLLNAGLRIGVKRQLAHLEDAGPMRARLERFARLHSGARGGREETLSAPGRRDVRALAFGPSGGPTLLYLHGGAFVAGSPRTHAHLARAVAQAAGIGTMVPDYRLAPEHPFPAAIEDAVTAHAALIARGAGPVAVAGDSAGGGLAAALCLEAARAGLPGPAALCLFSPWADMTGRGASHRTNACRDPMLPAERFSYVVGRVLQGADPTDPRASPAFGRFEAPPPALILVGRDEILLDDARALARALEAGGGDVTLEIWPRVPHAWPVFTGWLAEADRAVARSGRFLRGVLHRAA